MVFQWLPISIWLHFHQVSARTAHFRTISDHLGIFVDCWISYSDLFYDKYVGQLSDDTYMSQPEDDTYMTQPSG